MFDELRQLVPRQIRRSYVAKFGIVLLIIGMSVGLIGSGATVQITNDLQQGVDQEYRSLAEQEAGAVEQWLERNRLSTRLASESQVLKSQNRAELRSYVSAKRNQLPEDVRAVHLVDGDTGEFVASTANVDSGQDATNEPWWDTASRARAGDAGGVFMSEAYELGDTGAVSFASRVSTPALFNASSRVLVITVSLEQLGPTAFQGEERASSINVVDASNRIVVSGTPGQLLAQYPGDAIEPVERARQLHDSEARSGLTTMPGHPGIVEEEYVVGYAPIEGTDWVVVVHAPTSTAYGSVTAVSQVGLLATFAGVALITILGAFLGRNTASAIDRLTAKTQRMEEGDLSVEFETHRIDNIGRLYRAFASMRDALREQIQEAQIARQEAEEARERAEMMNRHLIEKADEYSDVMEAVAAGDLTRRMAPESRNEAMEEIARAFNEMIEEIEATTQQVKDFATEVATSSEEVTASSEEVKSASEQVTESIQEISDGAERQNEQLQAVSEEMNSLSTTIEEIASSANEVADLSQQTAETGEEARERAELAIDEMETVEHEADATVEAMERLQDQMEQIEEITEFITDVAEQTNILALNANIEAARAGEAGEGFAVVAEEVKSLAEETRGAAEEIDALVEDIRDQTERTAQEVQGTAEEVARSTEIVEGTVDALERIAGYAQETNTGVQQISDATTEQASSTNQVVGMVDEAASISEQTSRESENVAAAAEEQTTALTEVTNSASDLANQASRLSSALERFATEAEPVEIEPAEAEAALEPPEPGAEADAGAEPEAEPAEAEAEPAAVEPDVDITTEVTGDVDVADLDDLVGEPGAEPAGAADAEPEPEADAEAEHEAESEPEPAEAEAEPEPEPAEAAADAEGGSPGAEAEAEAGAGADAEAEAEGDDAPEEVAEAPEEAIDEWLDAQMRTMEDVPDVEGLDTDAAGEQAED